MTDVWFTDPQLSLCVDGDPQELTISVEVDEHVVRRFPAADVLAASVISRQPLYPYQSTRTSAVAAPRWLRLSLRARSSHVLGPLAAADAMRIATAFHRWRAAHPLERVPLDVGTRDLLMAPARFHGRRIRATAEWRLSGEASSFAGVWLEPSPDVTLAPGTRTARVVGTWVYPAAERKSGEGPDGRWPGMFVAERIELDGDLISEPVRRADYDRFPDERPFLAAAAASDRFTSNVYDLVIDGES